MGANVFEEMKYKKSGTFRTPAGVIAVLMAIFHGLRFLNIAVAYIDSYGFHFSATMQLVDQAMITLAMILCAINMFSSHEKRKSTFLGMSAVAVAISQLIRALLSLASIASSISASGVLYLVSYLSIGLIFILIALQFFEKIKINIKFLPISAMALSLMMNFFIYYYSFEKVFHFSWMISAVFHSLYILPFILFISLGSQPYKSGKMDDTNAAAND